MTEDRVAAEDVTADDIRDIVERAEAGVGELMTAYEEIEQQYFAAVAAAAPQQPAVAYATHT